MAEDTQKLVRREVRSPRSAAIAGIIFSLLMAASMILLYNSVTASPADIGNEWLETWSGAATVVLVLVPFAGIALLWFTGVMRDLVGDREDRFFSTVFLGSGIIIVVLLYTWAAAFGAIFSTYAAAADLLVDNDIYIYASLFMNQIIGNYFLRMAAVHVVHRFALDQNGCCATLADHRHLRRGRGVPAVRQCSTMGSVHFPCLGVSGERVYTHLELPPHPRRGKQRRTIFGAERLREGC